MKTDNYRKQQIETCKNRGNEKYHLIFYIAQMKTDDYRKQHIEKGKNRGNAIYHLIFSIAEIKTENNIYYNT